MRIVVCVKHVPDLASARGFDDDRRTRRTAADSTLNEVDENAIEAALQVPGENEVIALTTGPAIAVDAVRRALQMGVDSAVHVQDDALAGLDAPATARVLAAAIAHLARPGAPIDLVLAGMTALDGLGSVVPTLVGAELGWGVLAGAQDLTVTDGPDGRLATISRDLDGAAERVRAALPAVVSVSDAINSPRLPKTKDILAARSAPVAAVALADLGLADGAASSRTRVTRAEPAPERPEPVIVHDTGGGGRALADYLIRNDLLGDAR
ncbi:electron transfer flavoprotein subunit beta/FixA family protein [Pseudactinotalea sp. HY158]|uniref:electron transfer flavoprotein subunit beta/FixA family protein n=1 Tax=Pseudactinotalea sp. HY158 TaxID=2654547 RepID=UPI00129C3CE2|nr:electron transfer flavoprotein subunit beta/FixA family protein [Pseudactinotalea sp. HY158]QGH68919.1 electron transfer flavoprotein subunit beta [Pseudactinotalea sp. HY158]